MKRINPYPETHQEGYISIEQSIGVGVKEGNLGVQIADDGRIWICLNGIALIRFKPKAQKRKGIK